MNAENIKLLQETRKELGIDISLQVTTLQRKKDMLAALTHTLGIVTPAAEIAGVSRKTHYEWLDESTTGYDPDYEKSVADIMDQQIDFVENSLVKNIRSGDTTAEIFFLKCKAKKRGYVERQEIVIGGPEGKPIDLNLSSAKIDELLKEVYDKHAPSAEAGKPGADGNAESPAK